MVCCANLSTRYHELNLKIGDGGIHNTKLAATSKRGSQGRTFDHKQALLGGNPYFYSVFLLLSFSLFQFYPNLKKMKKIFALQ
jgi:hypothetical protein